MKSSAIVSAAFLILFIIGCSPHCRSVPTPYETTETYTDQQPYTGQDCVPAMLQGQIRTADTNGGWTLPSTLTPLNEQTKALTINYYVDNLDGRSGQFKVYTMFWKPCGQDLCGTALDQPPILIDTFTITAHGRATGQFKIEQIEDKRPSDATSVSLNADGEEYQSCTNVIKYRDIQKTRTVTRVQNETVCD